MKLIFYENCFQEPNKRIDIKKLLAMKVPKGPLIGKLKSGESIMLEDGTLVKPEDVCADGVKDHCPNILVVDCDHIGKLESIVTNSILQVNRNITKMFYNNNFRVTQMAKNNWVMLYICHWTRC